MAALARAEPSTLLFRAYVHEANGYATLSMKSGNGNVSELKKAALRVVMKRRASSDAVAEVSEVVNDGDALPRSGPESDEASRDAAAAAAAAGDDAAGDTRASASGGEEKTNAPCNKSDDGLEAGDYFVRIMWSSNDRFAHAIEECATDDTKLCAEASKWIVGNDSITTVTKCYQMWRHELTSRICAECRAPGGGRLRMVRTSFLMLRLQSWHAIREQAMSGEQRSQSADTPRGFSVGGGGDGGKDDGETEGQAAQSRDRSTKGPGHVLRKSASQGDNPILPPIALIEPVHGPSFRLQRPECESA